MAEITKKLAGVKVLIVDDDPDVLAVLKQAMQLEGALTQCCADGNAAVNIVEEDPPELLLLDMMLPGRSGFLVLEHIKKIDDISSVVIMLTANEGKRHQAYADTLGVDAYMHKPVRLELLVRTAVELLEKKGTLASE